MSEPGLGLIMKDVNEIQKIVDVAVIIIKPLWYYKRKIDEWDQLGKSCKDFNDFANSKEISKETRKDGGKIIKPLRVL